MHAGSDAVQEDVCSAKAARGAANYAKRFVSISAYGDSCQNEYNEKVFSLNEICPWAS